MPDIKTIEEHIRARLADIERVIEPLRLEAERLTKAAATFDAGTDKAKPSGASSRRPGAKATRTARKAAGAPTPTRAKRGRPLGSGNRAHQAVAKISEQPGITASELATAMGINTNYLYRVLPRLEKDAKVIKKGKGYHPVDHAPTTTQTNG